MRGRGVVLVRAEWMPSSFQRRAFIALLGLLTIVGMPRAIRAEASLPPHASFTINSTVLGEVRQINVYTPPGYGTAPDTRYPVLYMLDGGLQEDFPHVARDVDAAIRAGEMRAMIVVGIENTERRRDMTGPTVVASDRAIAPHVGGSERFRKFIGDELMPEVRHRYRTNGQRAMVGESLAGLFVVETFLSDPQLFDSWIALSPSLWWNNMFLARSAKRYLQAPHPRRELTLYVAAAGDDGLDDAGGDLLKAALRTDALPGLDWHYEHFPKLKHENIYRRASPEIFRRLFPPE